MISARASIPVMCRAIPPDCGEPLGRAGAGWVRSRIEDEGQRGLQGDRLGSGAVLAGDEAGELGAAGGWFRCSGSPMAGHDRGQDRVEPVPRQGPPTTVNLLVVAADGLAGRPLAAACLALADHEDLKVVRAVVVVPAGAAAAGRHA